MTEGARTVLELCQVARGELAESRMGSHWRLRWVTAITLLRTVAHVLSHINRNSGPELRQAIDEVWAGIKVDPTRPHIFHDLIEAERNLFLKEFMVRQFYAQHATPGK